MQRIFPSAITWTSHILYKYKIIFYPHSNKVQILDLAFGYIQLHLKSINHTAHAIKTGLVNSCVFDIFHLSGGACLCGMDGDGITWFCRTVCAV